MKKSTFAEIEKYNLPWIIFQLAGAYYAINTRHVSEIGRLEQKCTQIPESKPHIRGLITFRGKAIQVLDMRTLLGSETLREETERFGMQLNKGKSDHLLWVKTLEESVANDEQFTLTTDPHKCAFGNWYDGYHSDNPAIAALLKEIEEPHAKLHQTALEIEKCKKDDTEGVQELLKNARLDYIAKIMKLLDRLIDMNNDSITELMLVLEDEENSLALAVDRVVGVQKVEPYGDNNVRDSLETSFAVGVAKTTALEELVLLLDDKALLNNLG